MKDIKYDLKKRLNNYYLKQFIIDNKYKIGCAVILIASILLAVFVFSGAYVDFANACKNAFNYFKEYIGEMSNGNIESIAPPPLPTPAPGNGGSTTPTPGEPEAVINYNLMLAKFKVLGLMFVTGETYSIFGYGLLNFLMEVLKISLVAVPTLFSLKWFIKKIYFYPNTKHGKQTLPLKMWLKFSSRTVQPTTAYIQGLVKFIKEQDKFIKLLKLLWAFSLNAVTIVVMVIPFYFYFCISLNFKALFKQVIAVIYALKYLAMLTPAVIIPVILYYIDKHRLKKATARLEAMEAKNEEALKHRDIVTCKVGPMGTFKTYEVTDEALTLSVMQIKKADELKQECKRKFPFFNWILFDLDIEEQISNGTIFNWASAKKYVDEVTINYHLNKNDLYAYNNQKGFEHYNGLCVDNLFDVLKDYIRLHMLYVTTSSFIISNYPIREDMVAYTLGNIVLWNFSFFRFENDYNINSRFSKILDFDILRSGKRMEDIITKDSLEYGIICITEADKEQPNAKETLGESKESPYVNPENDGITKTEKFIRHHATVMNHCFVAILKDSQRAMSLKADSRQIGTIEHMQRPSNEKSALRCFDIEKAIHWCVSKIYTNFVKELDFYRGDTTLIKYFLTWLDSKINNFYSIRHNRYSYKKITIMAESGLLDGEMEKITKYLLNGKMSASRYNTATHEAYFEAKALASGTGIINYPSYAGKTMTPEEYRKQNSLNERDMNDPEWKDRIVQAYKLEQEKQNAEIVKQKAINRELAKKAAKEEVYGE